MQFVKRCYYCNKNIKQNDDIIREDKLLSNTRYYHLNCAKNLGKVKCFYCGKRINKDEELSITNNPFNHEREYYHSECYKRHQLESIQPVIYKKDHEKNNVNYQKKVIALNNSGLIEISDSLEMSKITGKKIQSSIVALYYVGGINNIDKIADNSSIYKRGIEEDNSDKRSTRIQVNIEKCYYGYKLIFILGFSYRYHVVIPYENIAKIVIEDVEQIYNVKDKSILGRSVAGGLLLGPLGAVLGGISGLGQNYNKVEFDKPDVLVAFILKPMKLWENKTNNYFYSNDHMTENMVIFSCMLRDKPKIELFFKNDFPNLLIKQ